MPVMYVAIQIVCFGTHECDGASLTTPVDWMIQDVVTPVKNQRQRGSCWAHSTTDDLEDAWTLNTGSLADTATAQKYARGVVRQAFNGIPKAVEVTDEDLTSTPTSIDWFQFGATTLVKDQGQCGSCWAYPTIEGIESAVYMAQGVLEELAVQQIILCDKTDGGCNGGDLHTAFDYVQNTTGGVGSHSDYPETSNIQGRTHRCEWDGSKVAS